jgi:hypothetical protein
METLYEANVNPSSRKKIRRNADEKGKEMVI